MVENLFDDDKIISVDKNTINDGDFYEKQRDQIMKSYLSDVGPISEFINKKIREISKDDSKEK